MDSAPRSPTQTEQFWPRGGGGLGAAGEAEGGPRGQEEATLASAEPTRPEEVSLHKAKQ